MPELTYTEVLNQVRSLELHDQVRLLEELAAIVRRRIAQQSKHNVMEFRGMAKDFWNDVDVEKFINEERNSWDGRN